MNKRSFGPRIGYPALPASRREVEGFFFRKSKTHVTVFPCCSTERDLAQARAGFSNPVTELKNLEDFNLDLDLSQPFEIPQNHQDIPWKSLALEPHFFGKAWQKSLGGPEPDRAGHTCSVILLNDAGD
jgi:hypothetical protein